MSGQPDTGGRGFGRSRLELVSALVFSGLFVIWAGLFIFQNSYIALDGQRYYGLFDDAMISMRYAWNFAHGLGLVWNAGERVEGYSNLLMTLIMSLPAFFLQKKFAVLLVQILGVPAVLGIAWLSRLIAGGLADDATFRDLVGFLVLASVLLYFPISYWTLMGMETGLLILLLLLMVSFGLRWAETPRTSDLTLMSVTAGLAFLTRNDSLVISAVLFAFVAWRGWQRTRDGRVLAGLLAAAGLVALFVVAQTLFRYLYYGQLLPNTYVLKLTRYPLKVRLIDGVRYVLEFLVLSWPLFLLAGLAFLRGPRPARVLLLCLIASVVGYQVYVGGDPWITWRLLAPAMPFVFILAALGAVDLVKRLGRLAATSAAAPAIALLVLVPLLIADAPFLADMSLRGPTSAAIANRTHTNTAIAISALTDPAASIGVIWAGTLPYYVDRRAIDYLGKSDPYIASLEADVSGSSGWRDQISIPGHNKYDLEYSIIKLRPTYSQAFSWGYATVRPFFVENYVRVEYHGAAGTKTLFLLKDSTLVCWEACSDQYRIIPWPRQE